MNPIPRTWNTKPVMLLSENVEDHFRVVFLLSENVEDHFRVVFS